MDIDNILDDSGTSNAELYISDPIRTYLSESARWAKFISIVSFVFVGLSVLGLLIGGGGMLAAGMPGMGGLAILIYIVFIGIAFIPIYYLYQFATKMQTALRDDSQVFLQDALENQKSMFKFYGIFLAIVLGIYALFFVIAIFAGLAM